MTVLEAAPLHADHVGADAPPYPPSWVDRLIAAIEDAPGPAWAGWLALTALGVSVSVSATLVSGRAGPDAILGQAFWGLFLPLTLWLVRHLSGVAAAAFDAFRPVLVTGDQDAARLRYELRVIPARPALLLLVASAVLTPALYIVDPEASGVTGLTPFGLAIRYVSETFFGALVFVLALQSVRQLRAVSRIHTTATRVDLFRPAPLYAFSVLTSRTASVIALVFVVPTLVAVAQTQSPTANAIALVIPWLVGGIVTAIVVFVAPLQGIQRRILAEKRQLQAAVGLRIERTVEEIHARVDAGDLAGAGSLQAALGVLLTERDLVDRLPTLPWRPGTLGGLFTAIVAPLGLFVATRILERLI